METITLDALSVGERAVIDRIDALGDMRHRLLDLGFVGGTMVECVGKSPLGDPKAYLVRGAVIALRAADAKGIACMRCENGTY